MFCLENLRLSIPEKSLFLMNLSGAAEASQIPCFPKRSAGLLVACAWCLAQFKQVLPDDRSLRDLGLKPGDRVQLSGS